MKGNPTQPTHSESPSSTTTGERRARQRDNAAASSAAAAAPITTAPRIPFRRQRCPIWRQPNPSAARPPDQMATAASDLVHHHKRPIQCRMLIDDKSVTFFELRNEFAVSIQKQFVEYELFYERVRSILPASYPRPPKRKFLLSDSKLVEKRRIWLEAFANDLMDKHKENKDVKCFLGVLDVDTNEDDVNLGPTERKSIKPDHFEYLQTIGKGSFGRVFMVRYRTDGKIYAMKVLGKARILKRNEIKHVMAERNVLKSNINHPFLVSLHYSFQTRDKLYFVLDFLNGGELFFHLQRERSFSESRTRFYGAEIASALGHLHDHNIIYRDLKPENLLLDKQGHVVITDFGLCKEGLGPSDTTNTFCGTPEYLAPEVIQKKPYGVTVDWWSLGAVMHELMFGLPPFYCKDQREMYERILYQPLQLPATASATARSVLRELLHKDRHGRLGAQKDFSEIRDHPFFAPIEWDKLLRRELKPPFVPRVKNETDTINIAREFTAIEPNAASLAPHTLAKGGGETDFAGFTYNQTQFGCS